MTNIEKCIHWAAPEKSVQIFFYAFLRLIVPKCCSRFFIFLLMLLLIGSSNLLCEEESSSSKTYSEKKIPSFGVMESYLSQNKIVEEIKKSESNLAYKGISLGCLVMNETWGNTTGGIKQGCVDNGVVNLSTSVDFDQLMGWKGGSFYSSWAAIYGENPSTALVGNLFDVSGISSYPTFRNIELWIQQEFLDDKISLRVGQLIADTEFDVSEYAQVFLNNTFTWSAAIYTTILPYDGLNYPVGVPGVRLLLKPTEELTLRAAIFQGDAYQVEENKYGFHWNLNSPAGLFYITEADYAYHMGLPGDLKVGACFDSGTYPSANGSSTSYWGNYAIYQVGEQMLYHQKKSDACKEKEIKMSDPGLGFFENLFFQPQDRNLFSFYGDTGFNYRGLIPERDQDVCAIGLAYGLIGNAARSNPQGGQITESGDQGTIEVAPNSTFEIAVETTYRLQLSSSFSIQPDLQYIIQPGGSSRLANALVLGLRTTLSF